MAGPVSGFVPAERTGAAPVGAPVAALMRDAEERAGSDDWGGLEFTRALALLLESCERTASLNANGQRVLRHVVLRHLRNRLYLQAHVSAHPEIAERPILRPVVITGLPRTGTTLLHNLMALDPASRVLRLWEGLHPVPAGEAGGPSREELIEAARRWLARLYELVPAFRQIHPATADGPEECDALLQNTFASQHFEDMFRADDYSRWLDHASMRPEYACYRLQLQVLSGRSTPNWVLKSPSHLGHLDALFGTCPGAVVVQCHRDPLEAVPSYASLVHALRQSYSDTASPGLAGRHALERCRVSLARALQVRSSAHPGQFVDVSYRELVADPHATVGSVYDQLGQAMTREFESSMRTWLVENPQHRHGAHAYSLATFDLTAHGVLDALPSYAAGPGAMPPLRST